VFGNINGSFAVDGVAYANLNAAWAAAFSKALASGTHQVLLLGPGNFTLTGALCLSHNCDQSLL
jgi:hypothetical protein